LALEKFQEAHPVIDDSARYLNINMRVGISNDWPKAHINKSAFMYDTKPAFAEALTRENQLRPDGLHQADIGIKTQVPGGFNGYPIKNSYSNKQFEIHNPIMDSNQKVNKSELK